MKLKNKQNRDLPGGPVVKNLPCNPGGCRFDPWSEKIPHATEQISPWATAREPASCNDATKILRAATEIQPDKERSIFIE